VREAKSKKLSDVSYTSKPHDPIVFFLDRCLGKNIVADTLRKEGALVETHDDHFAPDAKDEEWLLPVGSKKWIIFTKDQRIRYRNPEKLAVKKAKACVFTISGGDLKGIEMAEVFIKALPKIKKFVKKHQPPFIARVTKSGNVAMLVDFRIN